ncbi:CHAT domain-containing protein [Aquimarina aggregata]|uniref:CHAT domain-containing protein n=1 Tax=Aquimarina aggregata TaxID=1642818 RepID=UPI0024918448|nr:CHAT domain-containing protein [Aquimarina aggregata]
MSYSNITYSQTKIDTSTASQYFTKGKELLNKRKTDSSLTYFEKALLIYETIGDQKKIIDCYDKISQNQQNNFDYDSALVTAKKGLVLRQELFEKEHPQIALSYTQIGHIHKDKDQYQKAMDFYQKALKIQIQAFGDKDYRTADCYHNIGTIHLLLGKYEKALELYNKGLTIRINTFGKEHQKVADSYIDMGFTHYYSGKYQVGLDYCQKALKIRISIFGEYSPEVAFCYNYIGDILNHLLQFDSSLNYQKKALSIMTSTFGLNHPNTALCYASLGTLNRRQEKLDMALQYNNKALAILTQKLGKHHFKVAYIYNEIGIIYFKKELYNESLNYLHKSLIIVEKIYPKNHSYIGNRYNNIGVIYKYKGEYDKALLYYKKSITISGDPSETYFNIANIYKAKEDYDLAHKYYQKAITIINHTRGENNIEVPYFYLELGDLHKIKKEYHSALLYYQKALKIQKNIFGETHYHISNIYDKIASLYLTKKDFLQAHKYIQKSIKIRLLTDGEYHPRTSKSYNQIADLYHSNKKHKKALFYYEKAILSNTKPHYQPKNASFKLNQYFNLNVLLQTLQGKAKTLQDFYIEDKNFINLTKSINTYKKADTLIFNIRQTLKYYEDKIIFAKQAKTVYTDAIQAQLLFYQANQKKQSLERAFYYTERSRANILKGLLSESNAKHFNEVSPVILNFEQDLKAKIAFYTSKITNEKSNKTLNTNKIVSYENKLFDLSRRKDSLIRIIEKNYPKYYQLKYQTQPITVIDIQKKLDNNTTILEFFLTDTTCYAFIISKNDLSIKELPVQKLEKRIEKLRNAIISKNTGLFKKNAVSLYNSLIEPIKDKIKGEQLIIIPDGPLWHLNFELLLTNTSVTNNPKNLTYLLKDYSISYANSTNLLLNAQHSNKKTNKKQECLAFSFSDTTSLKTTEKISMTRLRSISYDLPGTREEIKAISDIIDGQYYFGSQAVERNFKKNANQYNILHLALHGDVDNDNPENSKLYFTKTKDSLEDNLLYSHELFALNIPADLTVLSACNTGTGKIAKGEGIMSLGNAFQYAGSKSLLLSSWEISDQTTPELMRFFYSNLKKGMNKPKALQQAKLQYLNTANINRVDPFYWGAFYLVGDIDPIQFKDDYFKFWMIGFVVIGILILIGIRVRRSFKKQH